MARAGWNAPRYYRYLYQMEVQVGEKISLRSTKNARIGDTPHQDEQHSTMEDEMTEFDSSSDEESCEGEGLMEEESNLGNLKTTLDVDFLIGATSRFVQSVRFYSRFVFLK